MYNIIFLHIIKVTIDTTGFENKLYKDEKYVIGRLQYILEKAPDLQKERDLELQKRFGDIKESEVKNPVENKPVTKPADNTPNIKELENKKILKKDHKTEDEKKAVRDWLFGRS